MSSSAAGYGPVQPQFFAKRAADQYKERTRHA
jgi:hypothetical protein